MPESKIPIGAAFIGRESEPRRRRRDLAGNRLESEIARKVGEVSGDVGFETGEEMIEHQEDDPILVLAALGFSARAEPVRRR